MCVNRGTQCGWCRDGRLTFLSPQAKRRRHAYDRWPILLQGRLKVIEVFGDRQILDRGLPERAIWRMS